MVIQRLQSLWLLIATVLIAVAGSTPWLYDSVRAYTVNDFPSMAVVLWLGCLFAFLAIFLFKNLRLQMRITVLSLLMVLVAVLNGIVIFTRVGESMLEPRFSIGCSLMLLIAVVCDVLALRGMSRDSKKLRNSDRLWS